MSLVLITCFCFLWKLNTSIFLKTLLDPHFARVLWIWVCPSIRTYIPTFIIYHSIFLRIDSLVFLDFLLEVEGLQVLKIDCLIFWENSCLPERGLKSSKWSYLSICTLLQYFSQDWPISFFTFCIKLTDHKYPKLTELNFWKNSRLHKSGTKKAQNDAICVFVCYDSTSFQDCVISFSWCFAWSWGVISTQNWRWHQLFHFPSRCYLSMFKGIVSCM